MPADVVLIALVAVLAVAFALYIRHGHRRIYRELRQLREGAAHTARGEALEKLRFETATKFEALEAEVARGQAEGIAQVRSELELVKASIDGQRAAGDAEHAWLRGQLEKLHRATEELYGRWVDARAALDAVEARQAQVLEQVGAGRMAIAEQLNTVRTLIVEQVDANRGTVIEEVARSHQASREQIDEVLSSLQTGLQQAVQMLASRSDTAIGELASAVSRIPLEPAPVPAPVPDPETRRRLQGLQIDLEFVKNRLSSYLGEGMGLTHLVDETPIYINTADIGCPANFINGGRYEEEYLQALASFCRPDGVFLDVGANLGVFSLRLAPYLRQGRIVAFEPNPRIRELFERSVHLNGLRDRIEIQGIGASDVAGEFVLEVPSGHAGGGHLAQAGEGDGRVRVQVQPLDEVLRELEAFHIAKIDVEGHELQVLRGMRRLIERSPHAVLLFEKLIPFSGLEGPLCEFLDEIGLTLWRIDGLRLEPVERAEFERGASYFLAARLDTVGADRDRSFVELQPGHLFMGRATVSGQRVVPAGPMTEAGALMFHGPYWYLPRGVHRVQVFGVLRQPLRCRVAEKYGYAVAEVLLSGTDPTFEFVAERDLTHFEVVGLSAQAETDFEISHIRVSRIG